MNWYQHAQNLRGEPFTRDELIYSTYVYNKSGDGRFAFLYNIGGSRHDSWTIEIANEFSVGLPVQMANKDAAIQQAESYLLAKGYTGERPY